MLCMQTGSQVVYSKYAGTELEFNGSNHLILKEDDILGILETDDAKDLKPLNERILIKVCHMTMCKCSVAVTTLNCKLIAMYHQFYLVKV